MAICWLWAAIAGAQPTAAPVHPEWPGVAAPAPTPAPERFTAPAAAPQPAAVAPSPGPTLPRSVVQPVAYQEPTLPAATPPADQSGESRAAVPAGKSPLAAPLPPVGRGKTDAPRTATSSDAADGRAHPKTSSSLMTVAGSLVLVLGLFLLAAWALRRTAPGAAAVLPGEVFTVLGRAPLAGRQQVHLLRCGNKLLLVSLSPTGAETLTEITDPLEVDRLAGLCVQNQPNSATSAFRAVLNQFAHPTQAGRRPVPGVGRQRRQPTLDDLEAEPHA